MKKVLWIVLLAVGVTLSATAQTQQGFVKTKGRLGANGKVIAGKRLSGVVVQVKGRSAVISKDDGVFSFPIPANQFIIQNVIKQGYVLADPESINRQFSYSTNPLVLVMETPQQHTEDKLANERKIRRNLQRQLQAKEDEIENLKEQNKISQEEYQQRLQQLYSSQESNEKLISEMAERYTQLDFDQMDEFNLRISDCILNGRLTEADSLLRSKGDINARIARYNQHHDANVKAQETLDKSKSMEQKDLEDIAQDCYHYYEAFLMKHQNDSAGHYLELRANLDTTNLEWQKEAGKFLFQYLERFEPALNYLQRGLRQAQTQYGEQSEWAADFLYLIGSAHLYTTHSDYDKARGYFQKAIDIWSPLLGEDHPNIASAYNELGRIHSAKGEVDKALELQLKALDIQERKLGAENEYTADSYLYLGRFYLSKHDFDKALEYTTKTLNIWKNVYGEMHPNIATAYRQIGDIFLDKEEYVQTIDYYLKALDIYETTLGKNHYTTFETYELVVDVYAQLGNYEKSFEYCQRLLDIYESTPGKNDLQKAYTYIRIGYLHSMQGNQEKALEFYFKVHSIYKSLQKEGDSQWQGLLCRIGDVYYVLGDYDKAKEYYIESIDCFERSSETDYRTIVPMAWDYYTIGMRFHNMEDYEKALDCYSKAINIFEQYWGSNIPQTAYTYYYAGGCYYSLGDYDKALECYFKAIAFWDQGQAEENEITVNSYGAPGDVYFEKGDYSNALKYHSKAYDKSMIVLGPDHSKTQYLKEMIDKSKAQLGL